MEEETEEGEQGGKSKTGTSVNGENEKEEIVTCKVLETQKMTDLAVIGTLRNHKGKPNKSVS